ncbi:S8 family serine peptidase [Kitasatospora sp. NPDC101183]|uniref:S8 family serine peptidase n=1 Tax=Kitasatospora sp. NPDC101183 TaxID=3364100 RepID=UPI00381AF645
MRGLIGVALAAAVVVGPVAGPAAAEGTIRQQQWHLEAMHAPEMWRTTKGQGIVVAVVDGGFDLEHPDLVGQFLPGRDFSGSAGGVGTSGDGHGTEMASLIAGTGKGLGGTGAKGLAPGVRILPLKINNGSVGVGPVTSSGFLGQIGGAITYAVDQGARVVSISQGMNAAVPLPGEVAGLNGVIAAARARGVLILASAGNSAQEGNPVEYPGGLPGVVAVGASDRSGAATEESAYGPRVAFVAPGQDMIDACTSPSGYCKGHGTSHATAVASASAALVWSAHPEWTANQVLRVLINTADGPKDGSGRTDRLGYGSVRPWVALVAPGDPGPADVPPLPVAEAATPTTPSSTPSSMAPAPSSSPKADASPSCGGSVLPLAAGVVVALAAVFAVLWRRRAAQ